MINSRLILRGGFSNTSGGYLTSSSGALIEVNAPILNYTDMLIIYKGFIDVGVNVGQTLLKLKSISSEINYLGFEPNPNCVNYLKNLITNYEGIP